MESAMRLCLMLSLAAFLPALAHAQSKKEPGPLKVVDLNRKDPGGYEKEIEPIFYKKWIACHSGAVQEGRFDISSYEGLVKGGKRGTAIVPAKGAESLIIKLLSRTDHKPFMPPRGEEPVTPEEMALVKLWIDQGAKAPTGVKERAKIVVSLP